MMTGYAAGAALALLPQWAGASVAILFSTVSRGSAMAVSLSLGTWILTDLLKYPLGVAPYFFTTYLEAPWQVFAGRCDALDPAWMPMAAWCAGTSLVTGGLAGAAAIYFFARRNLGAC